MEIWEAIRDDKPLDKIKLLIDSGANIETKSIFDCTALTHACRYGYTETVKLLIDSGANLEAKNNDGWTALMYACWYGHTETAKLLIKSGANIEAKDRNGWTALIYACRNGHTEIAKLLFQQYKTEESLKVLILTLSTTSKAYPFAIEELKRRCYGTMGSCSS